MDLGELDGVYGPESSCGLLDQNISCAEQSEQDRLMEQFEKRCLEHNQFEKALCADLGQPWLYEAPIVTVCLRRPG